MTKPLIKPVDDCNRPEKSAKRLLQLRERMETVPNFFLVAAHSPSALNMLCSQVEAASEMGLSERIRVGIGLRVSKINGCDYCLAAHTAQGKLAGVDAEAALDFRRGRSDDPKEQSLLALTTKIVKGRGQHARFVVEAARRLGISDAEIIEVIALIGLNTYMNYLNCAAKTEIDFPLSASMDQSATPWVEPPRK